jgi:cytochrome c oxidase subunit II
MEFFRDGSLFEFLSDGKSLVVGNNWLGSLNLKPPEVITTTGGMIDDLFNYTTVMNVFFFALVCVGIFGFSFLYRKSRHPKAEYTYGNKRNHLIATGLLGAAVFFLIDLKISSKANDDLLDHFWKFPTEQENPLKIEVLAQQWMWNFRYAGKDELFNTADDVLVNSELRIPKGRKVEFRITSKDVIHSFFVPNSRLKVDAIPGRITRMWFEATKTGEFDIACAEMCGTHHYKMQGKLRVLSTEDFAAWVNEAQMIAKNENDTENLDNYWGWKWENN